MKILTIISLTLLITTITGNAQTMDQRKICAKTPLYFRAVRSKAGGTKGITWQTDYGSQERTNKRTLSYTCQAKWSGKTPTNFTCQAYWIANAPKAGDFVINITYKIPPLNPGKTAKWVMTSPEIEEEKADYVAIGESTYYGAKLKGVIIRMVGCKKDANDYPLSVYASSSQWKKHGWKEDPNAQFKFNPTGDAENELRGKQLE